MEEWLDNIFCKEAVDKIQEVFKDMQKNESIRSFGIDPSVYNSLMGVLNKYNKANQKKDEDSFGMDLNFSMVTDGKDYEVGLHYTDSNGRDSSFEGKSDDIIDLLVDGWNTVIEDAITPINTDDDEEVSYEEYLEEYIEELEEENGELEDKISSLELDNKILQNRLNAKINDMTEFGFKEFLAAIQK